MKECENEESSTLKQGSETDAVEKTNHTEPAKRKTTNKGLKITKEKMTW